MDTAEATLSSRPVKFERLGSLDLPGGGQVVVEGDIAYVGHIDPPNGTSILDVSNPANPKVIARLNVPPNTHSHKVRARNGVMLVNYEAHPFGATPDGFRGGVKIFDVSRPDAPREVAFFPAVGSGAHRFDFDGRYAYLSVEMPGYVGNITVIVDLIDPSRPKEVSRWWIPGQWTLGFERPTWLQSGYRTHHPLRFGNRLYISCWQAGFAVVDISDISKPRTIARMPSVFGYPTHTVLPLRQAGSDRDFVVAIDEGWNDANEAVPGSLWVADISNPQDCKVISVFRVDSVPPSMPGYWGAHQPHEEIVDGFAFVAWFQRGLRAVDMSDPFHPRAAGTFMPALNDNRKRCMSNDLFIDKRRRLYLIDRECGLDILKWTY